MRSLKRTLLFSILGGLSLVVFLAGAAVYFIASSSLRNQHDASLIDRAHTLATLVIEEDDGTLEFEYDQPLDESRVGVLARVTAEDGSIVAQSNEWPGDVQMTADPRVGVPRLGDVSVNSENARSVTLITTVRRDPDAAAGGGADLTDRWVRVDLIGRMTGVRQAEAAVLIALAVGGMFALVGAWFAVWFGVRRGLMPVRELGSAVERIDTNELRLPAGEQRCPEELRPISSALQGFLDRLRAAMERERRFTDAAAHELRTPIAELKTMTEVADRWPDAERLQRCVRDAREVADQMDELLENLLVAARGSTSDVQHDPSRVLMLPLARDLSDQACTRLNRRDVTWSFEGDEDEAWVGPRGSIVAIARNLIENAAEYTGSGGTINVRVNGAGPAASFEVENGPITIDAETVERLFEPFWRADPARSGRRHRGLGLTIVDALAKAMMLDREVTITEAGRLRIRLTPRQPGPPKAEAA